MRPNVPDSLRFLAIEQLGGNHDAAWEKVLHSIKTGATALYHVNGASIWEYRKVRNVEPSGVNAKRFSGSSANTPTVSKARCRR